MNKILLVGFVFIALFAACQTQTSDAEVKEVVSPERAVDSAPSYDKEVAALLDKGKGRTSYHYAFNYKVMDEFGNYRVKADYEVFVKNDKVKKVYIAPVKLNKEVFYDNVYLDNAAKTALVTCVKTGSLCSPAYKKVYTADYEAEELPFTAVELLEKVPLDAQVTGTSALYGRSASIIEYGSERLYVDTYFGLPLKHEVYKVEGDQEIILEESTFTRLSVDVKDGDVTVPKDFVMVE